MTADLDAGACSPTTALIGRTNDLLASHAMLAWLIEVQKAGLPLTPALASSIETGVREGVLR